MLPNDWRGPAPFLMHLLSLETKSLVPFPPFSGAFSKKDGSVLEHKTTTLANDMSTMWAKVYLSGSILSNLLPDSVKTLHDYI